MEHLLCLDLGGPLLPPFFQLRFFRFLIGSGLYPARFLAIVALAAISIFENSCGDFDRADPSRQRTRSFTTPAIDTYTTAYVRVLSKPTDEVLPSTKLMPASVSRLHVKP